jgi:glycerol-1-phosphate dehydrogenase [NAD(P)+]
MRLLATALMLNGVSMAIAGSSRPASGSEHLISHALDLLEARPVLHGLQTGTAAYLMSHLQHNQHEAIAELFERTGFWESAKKTPFRKAEWEQAVRLAPQIKDDFHTILNERDAWPECERLIREDKSLRDCFE